MPSVASDPSVLPPRSYTTSVRNQPDSPPPSTPFADMLDSATASADPAPTPSNPPNRADRSDSSKPTDNSKADPASSSDKTDGKSAASANGQPSADQSTHGSSAPSSKTAASQDTSGTANDAAPATDSDSAKLAALALDLAGTAAGNAKPDSKPGSTKSSETKLVGKAKTDATSDAKKADADQAAADSAPDDAIAAVPAPATTPVPIAAAITLPTDPAAASAPAEATVDALTALQAVAQQAGAGKPGAIDGMTKSAGQTKETTGRPQAQGTTKDAAKPDAATQGAPVPADPKAKGVTDPQSADAGKDGEPRDAKATDSHHTTAELLAKVDGKGPQGQTDASSAAKASADAVANLGGAGQSNQPAAAQAAAAPAASSLAQPQAPAIPLAGLAVEIVSQANSGKSHFDIRLDPPELGRIDVRLHVDGDGNVSTRLIADRSDTLDLLKRDASGLERALQQAGLKTSDSALQFSLRQQQSFVRDDTPAQNAAQLVVADNDPAPLEALRQGYGRLLGLGGGLDIRV